MTDNEHTAPDDSTVEEEELEASASHDADRAATSEESAAADKSREKYAGDAEKVAENERSMAERGANVKGEGEIR
jgi:hypothetical protein